MNELSVSLFNTPELAHSKELLNNQDTFIKTGPIVQNNPEGTANPETAAKPEEAEEKRGMMGGIGRIIGAPFKYLWEEVKSGAKCVGSIAGGLFDMSLGAAWKMITLHPIEAIETWAGGLWDVVKSPFVLIGDIFSDTVNYVKDVFGGIGDTLSGAWDGVCDFFGGLFG
jgi:hypothetical protein